jgi:hypothetical protein
MQMATSLTEAGPAGFTVTRVAVFKDGLAYHELRGIYVIVGPDGRKYFGVSGIGITELGQHQVDKQAVQDER